MSLYWISAVRPGHLAVSTRPRGGDWLDDDVRAWKSSGIDMVVSMLTPDEVDEFDLSAEPDVCATHGILFRQFPIVDRGVPEQPDAFRVLVTELASAVAGGASVVIHCRQGIGRSAITAAVVLVLLGQPVDRAFELVEQARGRPVPDTPEQRAWVEALVAGSR